jgi:hypothetical protein
MFAICDARMHADGVILTPQTTNPQNHQPTKPRQKIAVGFRGDAGSLRDFARIPDLQAISRGPRIAS